MDGAVVSETLIEWGLRIIEIPRWIRLYRVELRPNRRLNNAEVIVSALTPESAAEVRFRAGINVNLSIDPDEIWI